MVWRVRTVMWRQTNNLDVPLPATFLTSSGSQEEKGQQELVFGRLES